MYMHKQKNIATPKITLLWRSHRKLAVLFLAALLAVLALIIPAVAYTDESTAIHGLVSEAASGVAVADALIEIPALGLSTRSNSRGEFSWSALSISGDFQAVTVQIQAAGYGNWTLENVRILRSETLILEAELKDTPQTITVPPPSNERPMGFAAAAERAPMLFAMGGAEDISIPETIRVRVTGNPICNLSLNYTVEVIDFKEYVKHVLPNEWISSWPWESLRSGAMATKMYAWYWVAAGGKWSDADVYDSTCDQVYNPAVSYASTNQAVDDTWNWRLTRDDLLIQTQYRAYAYQCGSADCMGQWDSRDLALSGWVWDEILFYFYEGTALTQVWNPPGGYSLRFDGIYNDTENRVLIPVDDPATNDPGPPVDVGGEDFTLEFWIKASPGENNTPAASCGANIAWQQGNLLFDRDRNGADRDFGLSLANGQVVFGVSGDGTGDLSICGTSDLADDNWHHVAVQRRLSDGYMWLYVDGVMEAEVDGPEGDISYPDDAVPPDTCGPSGTSSCTPYDPMLAIGAEKHRMDAASPSFIGWLDEIRFSNVLRYSSDFSPPADPFVTDADTVALYTLNEGYGNLIHDTSGATGGPSDGTRIYGGAINGPEWSLDTVWYVPPPTPTPTPTATPAPTSVTFAVIGDYGTTSTAASDVGTLVSSWNPDLILTTGDNNYPAGAAGTIDDNIGQYYSEFIYPYTGNYGSSATENRFFPSLGNHDWYTTDAQPYLDYFTLPGNERYYDFVWGPVHFFAIDSDVSEPDGISSASTQAQWLQAALSASAAPWKVVYLHHAPFSSSNNHGSTTELQWPFETWGADVVLAGHDHTYERLTVGSIPYFVNGLGGMSIYDFGTPIAGSEVRYNGDYGSMLVVADETDITYQFINRSDQVIDTFTQTKSTPTPTFEDVPADHWAFIFIETVAEAGLVSGYPDGTYRPYEYVTRAELAVMLLQGIYDLGGSYTPPPATGGTFTDIEGHWAEDWIEALAQEGITSGYGDGTFRPDNGVTRAEISIFLLRAKYGSEYSPPPPDGGLFSDIAGHWAEAWIEALSEEGITAGYPDGTYRPQFAATRAEMAVFLLRTFSIPLP